MGGRSVPETRRALLRAKRGLIVIVLCFHRHSRFVPSVLQSKSREVEGLRSPTAVSGSATGTMCRLMPFNSN